MRSASPTRDALSFCCHALPLHATHQTYRLTNNSPSETTSDSGPSPTSVPLSDVGFSSTYPPCDLPLHDPSLSLCPLPRSYGPAPASPTRYSACLSSSSRLFLACLLSHPPPF
ncbi:hypothetical protein BD626DRAFT_519521 [Schizophyllum amplum]|uniref:Uncharacterized protein n=1 Tax=Schizophyllum amplum TaxID=97359 RepID=A0A550BV69_9AGAR|nr:hypothetical protein BD626DRAFT_519521 [Auriculariopsis ampla]